LFPSASGGAICPSDPRLFCTTKFRRRFNRQRSFYSKFAFQTVSHKNLHHQISKINYIFRFTDLSLVCLTKFDNAFFQKKDINQYVLPGFHLLWLLFLLPIPLLICIVSYRYTIFLFTLQYVLLSFKMVTLTLPELSVVTSQQTKFSDETVIYHKSDTTYIVSTSISTNGFIVISKVGRAFNYLIVLNDDKIVLILLNMIINIST